MTAQQTSTIRAINDQLEADCWIADQAGRERPELDELSVLIAVEVKIAEGRMDEARAIWRAYREARS